MDISSLYIHFPYCSHLCNYCDFYKRKIGATKSTSIMAEGNYEALLSQQWSFAKSLMRLFSHELTALETLYIGGGTPSLWQNKKGEFDRLWEGLSLEFQKDYEFTIEVDPRNYTLESLEKWKALGVNRVSIGMQAYDNHYLKVLDRTHNKEEVLQTVRDVKRYFDNYSLDILIGAPKVGRPRDLKKELTAVFNELKPNHMSLYILHARKGYIHKDFMPKDDEVANEYLEASTLLKEHGFEHYEVSNFAKKNKRSRHNIKYWESKSVLGIGPSAASLNALDIEASKVQENFERLSLSLASDKLHELSRVYELYRERLAQEKVYALRTKWGVRGMKNQYELLGKESWSIEVLYMGLRAQTGFSFADFFTDNQEKALAIYQRWESLGYLTDTSTFKSVSLSSIGFLKLDFLIDDLFQRSLL